jgi:hypothetical protein
MARATLPPSARYSQPAGKPVPLRRSTPSPRRHLVTVEDRTLFERDRTAIVNKQFILEEGNGGLLCEVMDVSFAKGSWIYRVQYEGCSDTVNVPSEEMLEMLRESSLIET